MAYDYLIVGSGLFGATFAYFAHQQGKRCLVIDKRPQLGGNVYCKNIEGINVHQYGAHIFHTSNKRVWQFVNSLVEFNRYTNSPVANYQGKLYNLPFNMNTFYQMWGVTTPAEAMAKIESQREKQWGRKCTDLPAFIIKRLPVRLVFDNNYFNDTYQGIPIGGYNQLINSLLDGVETKTDVDFFDDRAHWEGVASKIVFTGEIDRFYDYKLGHLDFRTVRFETEVLNEANHQGNAVVNYTEASVPYTRIIEHKHFESFGQAVYDNPKTVISREYSTEWKPGMEPYYPVNDEKNNRLAEAYRQLAAQEENVIFGGRLAEYKYYDMAPVIEKVMKMFGE